MEEVERVESVQNWAEQSRLLGGDRPGIERVEVRQRWVEAGQEERLEAE
jgi:hypothetical protein